MLRPTARLANLAVVALVLGGLWLARERGWVVEDAPAATGAVAADGSAQVAALHADRVSGVMVTVAGRVDRTLPDDREGSRHQRFVVRLADGHTLLVAHNIDLAPRVPLEPGDPVEVRGQYEWNDAGGVLHWTHHDPDGSHDEGWIRHAGRSYD